ncbi:antirestriction protein ArdA (plasmid) [Klebsiella pneumoniae]|nr:antirestriction protein ArdA [Klebsiella pneumoniae]
MEELAYGFAQDHGLFLEIPESLRVYLDCEAYARDLCSSGPFIHDFFFFFI